jgi:type IV pilus assembly protein PilY1
MRIPFARSAAAASVAVAMLVVAAAARAQQVDVNPPPANVLLLIDNSGSMERMIDGTLPEDPAHPANACNCDATTGVCGATPAPPNRWGTMLQALTGTFLNGYNCATMPRTPGSIFANEYKIDGVAPYDLSYYIPYHRPVLIDSASTPNGCVYGPGVLPGAATPHGVGPTGVGAGSGTLATDFPSNAIVRYPYGSPYGVSGANSCGPPFTSSFYGQAQDGAIDTNRDIMRFGLMTFDQDPCGGTGVTAANKVDTAGTCPAPSVGEPTSGTGAFAGMWSYFPGWNTGGSSTALGNPAGCSTQTLLAVGARNPAAPPWEGRMMRFPSTTDLPTQRTLADNIQKVLLSTRPYGATPLAGMLSGAQYYFQTDPNGPQVQDTYVQGGCRPEYVILLTDGAPNLDMRPSCKAAGSPAGVCPFNLPQDYAQSLYTPGGTLAPVTTFVIGFAVSSFDDSGTTIHCSDLVPGGTRYATCSSSDPNTQAKYGPCCQLEQIAFNGGSGQAYFADTAGDLQNAIGTILSLIAKRVTTRTTPAYSPIITNALADPNTPQTNASLFLSSFQPSPGKPWSGDVTRLRFQCTSLGAGLGYTVNPVFSAAAGDDFAKNLNSNTGPARTFVALQPDAVVDSTATIRPYVATTVRDGLGKYSATAYTGTASNVISSITPSALNINGACGSASGSPLCQYISNTSGATKTLTACQCRDKMLDFTFGQPSFTSNPGDDPFVTRNGNAFGDVFHATPAVVGPPGSLLHDDSYIGFRSAYATRKQVVYVATNDGLLHAFWADETTLENNELWALAPPAVLPNIAASYPSTDKFLLDGSPVVKDVVWDRPLSSAGNATAWHTMLVAGFGPSQRGYYAVDVTQPDTTGMTSGSVPADPPPRGPVFRWQLTNMPASNAQLFGAQSGTPVITSVFADPGDGGGAREIGVAILPGGQDSPPTTWAGSGTACARAAKGTLDATPVGTSTARTGVRCWGSTKTWTDPVVGRSLSVVRLDTGEILRVFMRRNDAPSTDTLKIASPTRIIDTPLDSPMTGIPVVYPSDVGTDGTKVFIGDADGTIWRFNLSDPDPSKWVGEIFLDLYNQDTTAKLWSDGQPVEVPLVTSLDTDGNVVLHAATGPQGTFDNTGVYFVYSIKETVQGATPKLRALVDWWLDPATVTTSVGERVSGPMTVFDGVLYFATYAAAPPASASCTSGHGRIWGLDFVKPADVNFLNKGGLARVVPPVGAHPQYVQPDETDNTLLGAVIPGVSIKATPACAGLGTSGADPYVAGAQHSTEQNLSPGQYSVFSQVGATGPSGGSKTYELQIPTPIAPTMIDSWAAVLE